MIRRRETEGREEEEEEQQQQQNKKKAQAEFVPLRKKPRANGAEDPPRSDAVDAAASATSSDSTLDQEHHWQRLDHGITVEGSHVPPLMERFLDMPLPPHALAVLDARGVATPTAIQMQAVPCILQGRDVIGLAATGSGKTLSYILPLLVFLPQFKQQQHQYQQQQQQSVSHAHAIIHPLALIVTPTRELMDQVFHELCCFLGRTSPSRSSTIDTASTIVVYGEYATAAAICGGVSLPLQRQRLLASHSHGGVDIVVATPGRLLHLVQPSRGVNASLALSSLRFLVLDEVDRMLDAAMELQLRAVLQQAHESEKIRQTLLWSATMPPFLARLARSAVVNAVTIHVGMGIHQRGQTLRHVTQDVRFLRVATDKKSYLLRVLREEIATPPVLVFCNAQDTVEFVTRVLRQEQFHAAALHGDKPQSYRFQVLAAFRDGFVDVLVATDLAARGLDFADVDHVILFDMPHSIEDYVHRCGRTGRRRRSQQQGFGGGNGSYDPHNRDGRAPGTVISFLTSVCDIATELRDLLRDTKQRIPIELETPSRFQPSPQTAAT